MPRDREALGLRRRAAGAAVVVVAAALGGCGGASDQTQIRDVLARFARASASRDYATICSQLLSTVLVQGLTQAGLPCETALATGLRDVRSPRLAVLGVTVNGATASARVHTSAANQAPADVSLKLVKQQATWRISSLVPVAAAPAHSGHQ